MPSFPKVVPNIIAGEEREARSGERLDLLNPHDGSTIAAVASSDAGDVAEAVAAARQAQGAWAALPGVKRGEILHAICNAIEARRDTLAGIVAAEAGKRHADALGEANAACLCGRFFAGEGQRLFGRTMPSAMEHRWAMTVRQPCGVAGLIIAANTPAPNFAWKVFPALICGNAVVLKSAEDTPASAWFMTKVAEEAGLPKGVLNLVNGLGGKVGQPIAAHDGVDVISFTGSTRVGRLLAEIAGRRLAKISLELGGKNPFVVCDDADLDNAVRWACLSAFSNAGQRCAAASRMIVFDAVYDAFLEKFAAAAGKLKLGVGDDCDVGPVINARQLGNMTAAVEGAVARGAKVFCGGGRATSAPLSAGFYMEPTIIGDVDSDDETSTGELFGPITSVFRVAGYAEALALANRAEYGLTAAIHTRSVDRGLDFAARVRSGVATINGGAHGSEPHMPFGGVRASGNGTREPGTEALDVYSNLKTVYINVRPEA